MEAGADEAQAENCSAENTVSAAGAAEKDQAVSSAQGACSGTASGESPIGSGPRTLIPDDDDRLRSGTMQNPTCEEATCRQKYGIQKGYKSTFAERFADGEGVAVAWATEQNRTSDDESGAKILNIMGKQEKATPVVMDGGFDGPRTAEAAKANGFDAHFTMLSGSKAMGSAADFQLDDENRSVLECPNKVDEDLRLRGVPEEKRMPCWQCIRQTGCGRSEEGPGEGLFRGRHCQGGCSFPREVSGDRVPGRELLSGCRFL